MVPSVTLLPDDGTSKGDLGHGTSMEGINVHLMAIGCSCEIRLVTPHAWPLWCIFSSLFCRVEIQLGASYPAVAPFRLNFPATRIKSQRELFSVYKTQVLDTLLKQHKVG